jgi:hypothetical protein
MPYVGGKLAPWFDRDPNAVACAAMADRAGERMTALTKANTPVRFGVLRRSIKQKRVTVQPSPRGLSYESGCETDVEYAPYVEYDTGIYGPRGRKYEIRPKRPGGWLRWIDPVTGDPVFAKRVMHPGSPGNHMFFIGASITEHEFETLVQPILTRWARQVERQNRTGLVGVPRL